MRTTSATSLSDQGGMVASYCSSCCSCWGFGGDFHGGGGPLQAGGLDDVVPGDGHPAGGRALGGEVSGADPVVDGGGRHAQAVGDLLHAQFAAFGGFGGQRAAARAWRAGSGV